MPKSDGSVIIDARLNTSGMSKGVSSIESGLNKLSTPLKRIGGLIAGAFTVHKIIEFGGELLKLGSDLAEVQNVVDVTLPAMSAQIEEFAKNAADSFGLSETMAKRYAGTFGAMAKSFGYTERAAYDMATQLTGLAGDVASFYNMTQDEAYTKLKSVFTGETETLKELGVVMTQSALDQYALAKGYGKTTSKMTEQEKVGLRLKFVQEQLSAASGDFARTSDSWANQVRIMQLRLESLKATIGQGLINLFTPIIKAINVFLERLSVAAEAFKNFTYQITGKKETKETVSGLKAVQAGYEDSAESSKDFADSVEDSQKELKKSLAPFDEIIQLQTDLSEKAEETAAGEMDNILPPELSQDNQAEGSPVLDNAAKMLDAIKDRLLELKDIFAKGFWDGLGNYKPMLNELKSDLQKIGGYLRDIFTDADVQAAAKRFVDSFVYCVGTFIGALASVGLTIATNIVGGIESYLSQNVERIKSWLVRMFDIGTEITTIFSNFFIAFADVFSVFGSQTAQDITGSIIQIFADVFMGILELTGSFVRDILDAMLTPFVKNSDKIKQAISQTLEAIKPVVEDLADTIRTFVDGVIRLYNEHIHPLFVSIRDGLTEIAGKALDVYNKYIAPVLQKLGDKFKEVMDGPVSEAIKKGIEFVGKLIDTIRELWENVLQPVISWIDDNILPVVAPILEALGTAALDVLGGIATAVGFLFDALSGLIDFFTNIFSGRWKKAWESVKNIVESVWKAITSIIDSIVEAIKDAADAVSDFFGLSSKNQSTVYSNGKGRGSRPFSISYDGYPMSAYARIPLRMPRLATGTVVPPRAGEFAAILGDNNRYTEVVSPIPAMKQAFKEAIEEMGGLGNGQTVRATLEVDGTRFGQLVAKFGNQENQRVGVRLVTEGNA